MDRLSECCKARLTYYDKVWRDGICSECDEHSPELGEHNDEELEKA